MKTGMVSDSLAHLSFDDLIQTASQLGLHMLELTCGNWGVVPQYDRIELATEGKAS